MLLFGNEYRPTLIHILNVQLIAPLLLLVRWSRSELRKIFHTNGHRTCLSRGRGSSYFILTVIINIIVINVRQCASMHLRAYIWAFTSAKSSNSPRSHAFDYWIICGFMLSLLNLFFYLTKLSKSNRCSSLHSLTVIF